MIYNEDGKYIQLTAAGNPIGNKIFIQSASGTDVVVSSIEVDEEGKRVPKSFDKILEEVLDAFVQLPRRQRRELTEVVKLAGVNTDGIKS